jgi:CDC45-like protein
MHGQLEVLEPQSYKFSDSQFPMAFQEAENRSNARMAHSSFDASVVEVDKEDLQSFLTKLQL